MKRTARLDRRSLLVLALIPAALVPFGCSDDEEPDLGSCPPDAVAAELAGRTYIESTCAVSGCHGDGTAQAGVSLATLADIRANDRRAFGALEAGSMPPFGPAPAVTVENVRVFLACGARDIE